jgi:hypothetical protein
VRERERGFHIHLQEQEYDDGPNGEEHSNRVVVLFDGRVRRDDTSTGKQNDRKRNPKRGERRERYTIRYVSIPTKDRCAWRMSRTRSIERVPPAEFPHSCEELCEAATEQTHTDDDVERRDIPRTGLVEREEDGRRAEREEPTLNERSDDR